MFATEVILFVVILCGVYQVTLAGAYSPPCIARYVIRVALASTSVPHVIRRVLLAYRCDRGTTAAGGENGVGCVETLILIPSWD